MEITPDSADFIQIYSTFLVISSSLSSSTSDQDNIDDYANPTTKASEFQHNVNTWGLIRAQIRAPNFGMIVLYQHLYKKPHRNISRYN